MTWTFAAAVSVALRLCSLAGGSPKPDDHRGDGKMDVFRLPGTTWPESYDLTLVPVGHAFSGTVRIVVVGGAAEASAAKTIVLNLKDLNVTALSVERIGGDRDGDGDGTGAAVTVAGWDSVARNEQLEIRLKTAVVPGRRYLVTVAYTGPIRDDHTGWYSSAYVEGDATKWMAVTHFEPTYARRAFPCYDEPAYKAVFNVSVVKLKHQTVLSNMPIMKIESTGQNDTETVRFQSTPLMSTYLLAFCVGELVPNKNGSEITVYTHKDVVDQAEYAWNEAPKHFYAMNNYTGVSVPLTKLDLVAVPDDSLGAMENWGMNTFREQFLLLHDESKTVMKIHSSTVLQHEIAHNWFGNLVTCAWWDYAWLNEGFAQYFEFFATEMVRTTWPVEEWFVLESHQYSMRFDQSTKHPITASVNSPEEILAAFDAITYEKAASVIRMLRYLVTENLFRLSLRKYLNTYKYNVTVPNDLFASFDNVLLEKNYTIGNELSVYEFMSNWTLQSGYPVLDITKNETSSTFCVTQSRFTINANDKAKDNSQAWNVGFTYTTELSKNFNYSQPSAWSNKVAKLTIIPAPSESGWYIFNIQSTGYYRVNYDTNNWIALIKQLNDDHGAIHLLNRAQIVDDAFALARAGLLDYSVTLRLSKYLKKEDNVVPFYSAMNGFSYLMDRMRRDPEAYEKLKAYIGRLAGRMFKNLDILVSNGSTDFNVMCAWNSFSVWACCKLENADCTMKALEYFEKWRSGEKISADIKDAAFCMGVKNSNGDSTFNKMFELYTKTTSISEQTSAELALGCSTNRTQLTQYINHIIDGSKRPAVTSKHYTSVIRAISLTPLGLDVLYEFLSTNLKKILDEVHSGESIVTEIYSILAHKMIDDGEIEKLKHLKDNLTLLTPVVKSSFDSSFEQVTRNLAWYNVYADGIGQWAIKNEEEKENEQKTATTAHVVKQFPATSTTTVAPEPTSSSTTLHPSFMVLQITLFTVLIKIIIL